MPKVAKALVIDDAGMGKTTLSRYLLIQATKNYSTVPIFIELRHLTTTRTIIDIMLAELNPIVADESSPKIDKRQVIRLLDKGLFTFFLDGYDEIASRDREAVTIDIKRMTDTFPENKFLITSRPDHALTSFPAFRVFKIRALKKAEAYALIRKYDSDNDRSKRLIERLEDKSLRGVHEFLSNPLLTTLLYRAYDYKQQIPLKKPVFYRQVYDALFEWHDLTKDGYSTREKRSGLDSDSFHKVLRGLGFVSMMKGKVEATTDEWLGWIRDAKSYAPELKFAEGEFLEDAIKAVPILRREGNAILWTHKSPAEYFAAQFIVHDSKHDQTRICAHICKSNHLKSYSNFLDLLYDSDTSVFHVHFTMPLISRFEQDVEQLRSVFPHISLPSLHLRAGVCLTRQFLVLGAKDIRSNKIAEVLAPIVQATSHAWYGEERPISEFDIAGMQRLRGGSELQGLVLLHPLNAVFDILVEKKSPAALGRAFLPTSPISQRIAGSKGTQIIGTDPKSLWNSLTNFNKTTAALMRLVQGVLQVDQIPTIVRMVEASVAESKLTSSLLDALR